VDVIADSNGGHVEHREDLSVVAERNLAIHHSFDHPHLHFPPSSLNVSMRCSNARYRPLIFASVPRIVSSYKHWKFPRGASDRLFSNRP
jgi:hypothetical protein